MSNNPVIIDTDPGIDDAMAILFAILSGVRIAGITTVYGNAIVENTTRNARMILELCKRSDIGVYQGASQPLEKQPRLAECHGSTGMGNFSMNLPKETTLQGTASEFLSSELSDGKRIILCLSPLTNLAQSLSSDPSIAANIESIVFLGGSFDGPGNVSPYAEFNVYNDPDALDIVLQSPIQKIIIPIEICRKVTISKEEFDVALQDSTRRADIHSIVDTFIDYYQNDSTYGGFAGGVMYDVLVVGYYLFPDLFTITPACIAVDTSNGEKRGETSLSTGPENAFVVRDIDATALKRKFLEVIGHWNTAG